MFIKKNKSGKPQNNVVELFDTVVGKSAQIHGRMVLHSATRIDGHVSGDIESAKHQKISVAIGKQGKIDGDIYANQVFIAGEVNGNIYANDVVELHDGALVNGDISYGKLVIRKGSRLNGLMISRSGAEPTGVVDPRAEFVLNGGWKRMNENT
jgi:cytoskeletal protein CcmA (bactofilin family)